MVSDSISILKRYDKQEIIDAIVRHEGVISRIAHELRCDTATLYRHFKQNQDLKEVLERERDNWRESLLDLSENTLKQSIESGNVASAMFALRTRGKERGWGQDSLKDELKAIRFLDKGHMDRTDTQTMFKDKNKITLNLPSFSND